MTRHLGATDSSRRMPSGSQRRQLDRWHVDERLLPPSSVIEFREPSLWREYRSEVVIVVGAIALGQFQTLLPVVEPDGRVTGQQIILYSLMLVPVSLLPAFLGISGRFYLVAALVLSACGGPSGQAVAGRRGPTQARCCCPGNWLLRHAVRW